MTLCSLFTCLPPACLFTCLLAYLLLMLQQKPPCFLSQWVVGYLSGWREAMAWFPTCLFWPHNGIVATIAVLVIVTKYPRYSRTRANLLTRVATLRNHFSYCVPSWYGVLLHFLKKPYRGISLPPYHLSGRRSLHRATQHTTHNTKKPSFSITPGTCTVMCDRPPHT